MPLTPRRIALATAASLLASGCGSTRQATEVSAVPVRPVTVDAQGVVPDYCPKISLREGTAVLRKGAGEALEYVASITRTTRECHVVDGELRLKVGVAGRVVPGSAKRAGNATLPIRVAVAHGADVLYSKRVVQTVAVRPGSPNQFVYVDDAIAIPEPTDRGYVIFVGFDEAGG